MSMVPPTVLHPHTELVDFLKPWEPSSRVIEPSWFDWAVSLLAVIPRPAPVTHNHYSLASSHNVTVIRNDNHSGRRERNIEIEQQNNPSIPSWVFPVAGTIAVFAAVLVGMWGNQLQKAKDAQAYTHNIRERNLFNHKTDENCEVCGNLGKDGQKFRETVRDIFFGIKAIQQKAYDKQWAYTWGSRFLLVGSSAAATGALITAPWLVTAGAVTGLFSVLYMAMEMGAHWSDETELDTTTANTITDVIRRLKNPTPAQQSVAATAPIVVPQATPKEPPPYEEAVSSVSLPKASAPPTEEPLGPNESAQSRRAKKLGKDDAKWDVEGYETDDSPEASPRRDPETDLTPAEIEAQKARWAILASVTTNRSDEKDPK